MATADLPLLAAQSIRPFESIPVIDISGLSGDADSKAQVANAIREACIHVGFFYVKNHGVDETVIASTVEAAHRFYDLPLEEKMKLEFRKNHNLKGYYPPDQRGRIHESFEIRPEDDSPPDNSSELHLWPPEDVMPGFREVALKYYEAVNGLGLKLFQALALALNMPEDFFADKVNSAAADMHLVYYPSRSEAVDNREPGIGAHTDFQCFTILWQGEIPALQVKNASGQWIGAQPIPGTFVVNIADQLSRWTNDIFKSTVHRVIIESGVRRISIPLFFGTDDNVMVEALPSCVSASRPARYEPILAGDYLKLRKTKVYKLSK
ncbi:unnamed protein product [Rhizoctonia solani]|uniref:Fe2OG dioxygenase domain-containing protein n=1 Tax=Rhizoctonia solani TaxID=456999 RepID=A0A8H3C1K1_9AGAM|nr:unnamed protein product [Rhizoctonia solani]